VRRRPNFSVTASVLVLLVLLAVSATFVKPLIPPAKPNSISTYPGDYLKAAADQPIDWHPLEPTAFAEARRLDRPIFLLIGVAWSQNGREFDSEVLQNTDIENYLSQNYLCIRADSAETPAWASCYLPVSRAAQGIRPRFQIWIMEPDGHLIDNISRRRPESHLDQNAVLDELIRVRHQYTELRQRNADAELSAIQGQDRSAIETASTSDTLNFQAMLASISASIDATHGGLPINGYQDMQPYAWAYLAQRGQRPLLRESLLPILKTPIVDVLDGGFFVTSRQTDWNLIEYDKIATKNADMALTLAQIRPLITDPTERALWDFVLQSTCKSLREEFVADDGLLVGARIGDEGDNFRSSHSSVTPQWMRNALSPAERDWARKHLNLKVETSAQLLPVLTDADSVSGLQDVREKLVAKAPPKEFSTGEFMDVNGMIAAKLMQVGRITGDQPSMDFGSALFDRLDTFRTLDQVPHDLKVTARAPSTIQDFLSYSDAALQDYLSSGRVVSLRNGLSVLQRALSIFAGPTPGEYLVVPPPSSDLLPPDCATAQIVDDFGESTSAQVVRLCTAYGRLLLGNPQSDTGIQLLRTAYATASLLSTQADQIGMPSAAFACASLTLADDEYAVVVGPGSVKLANDLCRQRPTRFIAPVAGDARLDLVNSAAGIYIVRKGSPNGPYTLEQAVQQLSLTLTPGP